MLPFERPLEDRLVLRDDVEDRTVYVGQLAAVWVNLPVVGVALDDYPAALTQRLRDFPRASVGSSSFW